MKVYLKSENGEYKQELSPIVSKTNFPKQLAVPQVPNKADVSESFDKLTPEILLSEMSKAGGRNLVTEQFAVLLAPKVKRSQNELEHHQWDLARSRVLSLMRLLEKQGKITITKSKERGKLRYKFNLV